MKMIQEQTPTERERSDIEKTASTIEDLQRVSNVPYSREILSALEDEIGEVRSFCPDLSWLAASRHLTSRGLIEQLSPEYQVIEMGAGFSPHGLNYSYRFGSWTEVDLPHNSKLKERVARRIAPKGKIEFVAGDIYSRDTWERVMSSLDLSRPSFIFCEGVVSQYGSEEQKDILVESIGPLIIHPDSRLYIDDTFKNHPEISQNPRIQEIMGTLRRSLKRTSYAGMESRTLEDERSRWKARGLSCQYVPYVITSEEFRDINEKLRGFLLRKNGN